MFINEVSKITGLTKKAIEYYTLKGLISPIVLDNGYRDYSEYDIDLLNKIYVLRKLSVGTDEIKSILSDKTNITLQCVSIRKELDFQRDTMKKEILEKLSSGKPYSEIHTELNELDDIKTITEGLLEAFPGYYGRFICLHFARFLNEPIKTESQKSALDTIIAFLDNIEQLDFPQELESYLIEGTKHIGIKEINEMIEETKQSIENIDLFLSDNEELLERYLTYKQSDEYKNSPAYKAKELLKTFNCASGYNDIFIPAMKQLSTSYAKYYSQLELANEKLISRYPEIENLDIWLVYKKSVATN